jgi:uncharacterized protein YoxC
MILVSYLVFATFLGSHFSFVQRSHHGKIAKVGRHLRLSSESDPVSISDILDNIVGAPQRISDSARRISATIQAAPQQISDSTQKIIDKIQATPDDIARKVDKVSRNVKDISDAVVYFPSNVTAAVAETQLSIEGQANDVKKKVKDLSPMPFINGALSFTKNIIDTAYDLKEGKISGGTAFAKLAPADKVKAPKVRPEKTQTQVYEDVKENLYLTLDNINGFGRGVVETAEKVVATAERVQQFPDDIKKTRDSVTLTAEIIQKDIEEKQQQAQDIGKVIWKVVTLDAAKETYERTEKQYQSTVEYVTDVKTMLQTNPIAVFTGGMKKETPIAAPVPVVVAKQKEKDKSAFGKVWGALQVTKAGIDATVSTVVSASNGVKGLKRRIDSSIAEQEASEKKNKVQPAPAAPSITSVTATTATAIAAPVVAYYTEPAIVEEDVFETVTSSTSSGTGNGINSSTPVETVMSIVKFEDTVEPEVTKTEPLISMTEAIEIETPVTTEIVAESQSLPESLPESVSNVATSQDNLADESSTPPTESERVPSSLINSTPEI